jgi:hypothetical protein
MLTAGIGFARFMADFMELRFAADYQGIPAGRSEVEFYFRGKKPVGLQIRPDRPRQIRRIGIF